MPENHDPTQSGKTGRDKRSSTVLPTALPAPDPLMAPEVKSEGGEQQSPGCQEENPFWRDKAQCYLEALATLTNPESSAPPPAAK